MKITSAIIASFMVVLIAWGQDTGQDKYAIKVYNMTSFEDFSQQSISLVPYVYSFRSTSASFQMLHPTIAFQWKATGKSTTGNTHEIELTRFSIDREKTMISGDAFPDEGLTVVNTALAARYEYVFGFKRFSGKKLRRSLGLSVGPYFNRTNSQPIYSTKYPSVVSYLGTRLFVTPHVTNDLTKRVFVDVNIPICLFESYMLVDNQENPAVPAHKQRKTSFTNSLLPNVFSARIGVGVRI